MVLVASSNNRRDDPPVIDINKVLSTADSLVPEEWVTTFNNEREQEIVVTKHSRDAKWKSLATVRGYVYKLTRSAVSAVSVSGTRCAIHRIDTIKPAGNKEIVDIVFAIDYTCVQSADERAWKLEVNFPPAFTPMCCASKQSDFQYLVVRFEEVGAVAVDVTPVSFSLIWDIPGACEVLVSCAQDRTRTIHGQLHKMEVVNVEPGCAYTVKVSSAERDEHSVVVVEVPHRTVDLMQSFFNSKRLADQRYDLSSVSAENIAYLRRNKVLKSGHKLVLRSACKTENIDLLVATCGDSVELSAGKNIYVVPEFDDNNSQYICLQQHVRNFMLEFDRSESFVKYNGAVYPHGAKFSLDNQCVEVVKGSIILLVTESDAITPVAFPGGQGEATTVQNAGDVIVRDIVMRDLYQVADKVSGETTYVANSFFVYDSSDNSTTECSRVSSGLNDDKNTGSVSIDVLHSSGLKRTFETTSAATNISSTNGAEDTTATFAPSGLHFDSDKGDIYFGADKDFRIHFADVNGLDPAMLQIQSLSGSEYITRFLVTSQLP